MKNNHSMLEKGVTKKNKSLAILFIGNSFSYFHGLPKLIADFAMTSNSTNLLVDGVFRGGADLKMFWQEGRALKKLRSRAWNYVVLQERGRLGGIIKNGLVHVGRPEVFYRYATRFHKEIKKINAKTILYCPPAFLGRGLSDDSKKLHLAHVVLARKLHALMIPSGTVFAEVSKKRPTLNLYEHDGHHHNSLGAYLIACLFYKKIFHKRVFNLPLKAYFSRSAKIPKNPKTIKLSKASAKFLWSIVNHVK